MSWAWDRLRLAEGDDVLPNPDSAQSSRAPRAIHSCTDLRHVPVSWVSGGLWLRAQVVPRPRMQRPGHCAAVGNRSRTTGSSRQSPS